MSSNLMPPSLPHKRSRRSSGRNQRSMAFNRCGSSNSSTNSTTNSNVNGSRRRLLTTAALMASGAALLVLSSSSVGEGGHSYGYGGFGGNLRLSIQSLNKTNIKSYLQTAQILDKTALKSACWALVRENYDEFHSDPDILKLFEGEDLGWKIDDLGNDIWKPLISLINAVSKKRKRSVKIDCGVNDKSKRKKKGSIPRTSRIKQSSITRFFQPSV